MIISTRADESWRGITHADAETSGAWRHDQSVMPLFRIFRPGGMWSHRVWSQPYNGQDQNKEKVERGPQTQCKQFATANWLRMNRVKG